MQAFLRACRALILYNFGKRLGNRDRASRDHGSGTTNSSAVQGIDGMVVEVELSTMYVGPDEEVHPTITCASPSKDHTAAEDHATGNVMDNTTDLKAETLSNEPPFRSLIPVERRADDGAQRHRLTGRESDEARDSFRRQI